MQESVTVLLYLIGRIHFGPNPVYAYWQNHQDIKESNALNLLWYFYKFANLRNKLEGSFAMRLVTKSRA